MNFLKCIIIVVVSLKNIICYDFEMLYCVVFVLIFVGNCRFEFAYICNRDIFIVVRNDNFMYCEVIILEFI